MIPFINYSEDLRGLCLPSSSNLTDEDRDLVVDSIRAFFNEGK